MDLSPRGRQSAGAFAFKGRITYRLAVQAVAWAALLAVTGWLVRAEAVRRESHPGVRLVADVVYRVVDGRPLRLDVYAPLAAGRARPALLAIHGGGWRGGCKADMARPEAGWAFDELARRGLVVVAVDYRLSAPGRPSWPGNLNDVREAVRWVRGHADEYGIDPDRIAVLGASAGGNLGLLLGLAPTDEGSRVAAVVDFYGPTDLRALAAPDSHARRAVELHLGGSEQEVGAKRYDAASPLRRVGPDAAPILIIHGGDDLLVPLDQSRRLAGVLQAAGVPHRFVEVAGSRHGFGLKPGTRDLIPSIIAFLDASWMPSNHDRGGRRNSR